MRKRFGIGICLSLGMTLGFAVGYVAYLVRSVSENPALARVRPSGDGFNRVFDSMARLGADESVVTNCNGEKPMDIALSSEAATLSELKASAKDAGLSPPIDLAEARLIIRRPGEGETEINTQTKTEETVQSLLKKSAWWDTSPAHMRRLIAAIDKNGCTPTAPKGTQRK